MKPLCIEDLPVSGKKVLVRVDFNVPLDNDLNVVNYTRIEKALPSIRYLLDKGASIILMSHLGRPKGVFNKELSLKPVAKVLQALLKIDVLMAPNCVGEEVEEMVTNLKPSSILLLENLRFHRAETHPDDDPEFAKQLASYADFYIDDAFASAHREHSSTFTITQYFKGKAAAGFLLEQEMRFLGGALDHPKQPFYAVMGGAKISTKMGVIHSLLGKVDKLLIGGGMAYTFLKAKGVPVGDSLVDDNFIPATEEILEKYQQKIILPIDVHAANAFSEKAKKCYFNLNEGIEKGFQGLDIGDKSVDLFSKELKDAGTIIWNGPLGVYEFDQFKQGTLGLEERMKKIDAIKIAGGGDLIAALKNPEAFTHISTGGGSMLEYIEYGTLPGIEALKRE